MTSRSRVGQRPVSLDREEVGNKGLRTIGEVSAELDVPKHVLLFWETKFPEIHPIKRGSQRYYRSVDVKLLRRIHQLVVISGFSLTGVRSRIRRRKVAGTAAYRRRRARQVVTSSEVQSEAKRTQQEDPSAVTVDQTVAERLGGASVLGRTPMSLSDVLEIVTVGLPVAAVDFALSHQFLTREELANLVLPLRTLAHRRSRNQPLTTEESERLVRVIRTKALAERTFASKDKAERWLRRELAALGGRQPVSAASTEAGARLVEQILAKIAYGAAA
ncbi:MAG: MerR family transcriptional regulator [Alphaproteobacteria bacterium]